MKKLVLGFLLVSACGHDNRVLFTPKPECKGAEIVPYTGTYQQVISTVAIGSEADGFDLDGDGKPDNKLAAVGTIAQSSISDAFTNDSIVIPLEFFDMPSVTEDSCVKFAVYYGAFTPDDDGDGKKAGIPKGDCNDHDPTIHPGAKEIIGNFKDDDCDGLADEDAQNNPSTDTMDRDGDGYSMADGDCDDTNPMVHPGMPEICGDGLDNDCDGEADRSHDAMGNTIACSPYDPNGTAVIPVDPVSLDADGNPLVSFNNGSIDKSLNLLAGPSIFSINIPITSGVTLDLTVTGATIEGSLGSNGTMANGRLGGIIDARSMDTLRGLTVTQIGLTPDDSLLDAVFANALGPLLALPKASAAVLAKYPNCRTPDIDVDGDGLEAFCSSNPDADDKVVDVCIDGDGTEIHDTVDDSGNVTMQCTEALDKNGKPRFVDGISVELNFATTPIKYDRAARIDAAVVLPLLLASASPRRRELLERVGVALEVRAADIDETPLPGEPPAAYVARVARAKAMAVPRNPGQWVLAADTTVTIDGVILGKAASGDQAAAMLRRLAGRVHQVITAFAIVGAREVDDAAPSFGGDDGGGQGPTVTGTVASEVEMVMFDDATVADYVASGEWRGKAGAYAVQGIGAALVKAVRGSVTNVIGLPLVEVLEALRAVGAPSARLAGGIAA